MLCSDEIFWGKTVSENLPPWLLTTSIYNVSRNQIRGRLSYSGKTASVLYLQPRSKQTCFEKGAARRRQRRRKITRTRTRTRTTTTKRTTRTTRPPTTTTTTPPPPTTTTTTRRTRTRTIIIITTTMQY